MENKENGPFNLKMLNRWLNELAARHIVIKKRGSPIDVDQFLRKLSVVKSGGEFTVFFTRMRDNPWMLEGENAR